MDGMNEVVGGVDTHAATHCVAAIDSCGGLLATAEFAATALGYRRLLAWLRAHGRLVKVGVEGTGSYGAGLTRLLIAEGVTVVEVPRPDRRTRAMRGKSDPIDAEAAARAALAGTATAAAKHADGVVESIRQLRLARSCALISKGCPDPRCSSGVSASAHTPTGSSTRPKQRRPRCARSLAVSSSCKPRPTPCTVSWLR